MSRSPIHEDVGKTFNLVSTRYHNYVFPAKIVAMTAGGTFFRLEGEKAEISGNGGWYAGKNIAIHDEAWQNEH